MLNSTHYNEGITVYIDCYHSFHDLSRTDKRLANSKHSLLIYKHTDRTSVFIVSPISSVTLPAMLNSSGLENSSASSFSTPGCVARLQCSMGAAAAHQQCCSHTPPHFQALALPSGYWHLNLCICWLGEGMKEQYNSSVLMRETKGNIFQNFLVEPNSQNLNQ